MQIRLFQTASVVIAVHGAGLANLLYSVPGSVVIEAIPMVGQDGGHVYYLEMAQAMDLVYIPVLMPNFDWYDADVVPLDALLKGSLSYAVLNITVGTTATPDQSDD